MFREFVGRFKKSGLLLTTGVLAAPVVALLADLAPVWPRRATVVGLSCVFEACLLMYGWLAWRSLGRTRLVSRMRWLALSGLALLVAYAITFSTLTVETEFDGRVTVGYSYRSEALERLAARRSLRELLMDVPESEATAIWTPASVAIARASILVTWLGFLAAMSSFVACFTLANERRPRRR